MLLQAIEEIRRAENDCRQSNSQAATVAARHTMAVSTPRSTAMKSLEISLSVLSFIIQISDNNHKLYLCSLVKDIKSQNEKRMAARTDLFASPDYFLVDELLTEEQKLIRDSVRSYVKKEITSYH